MAAVEQQRTEIHALVQAALQTSRESPDTSFQIEEALASDVNDPLSDDFILLTSTRATREIRAGNIAAL